MKVYTKCHTCHANRPGASKVPRLSRKTPRRQFDPLRPPASADLYEGLYKAPRLSRKSTLRSRKCHACHAKHRGANSTHFVRQLPPTSMKVYKVPHLSRKSTLRSRKCHACHAKHRGANSTHFVRQLPPTSMKVYKSGFRLRTFKICSWDFCQFLESFSVRSAV